MNEKTLIFIPYQDTDNFFSDGILTREYAMLYLFWRKGYQHIINVKKPRTFLDKKRYQTKAEYYPEGTVEYEVKRILEESQTIQYLPLFDLQQILYRRGWWKSGYEKTIPLVDAAAENCLVYSNNPFAAPLLRALSEKGCKVYFDIMDNFAIHPSLSEAERKQALEGYQEVFRFSDCISANSQQTCNYMRQYTNKDILLVKNGVFPENTANCAGEIPQLTEIREKAKGYRLCVGYVGKLGLRLDADLIEAVSKACPDVLFVFIGCYLKGQLNEKLHSLFHEDNNVVHISAIPSAYVCTVCREFDALMIPHSVGQFENGGDPLKIYQYLSTRKPIITTSILGVDEYSDYIRITNEVENWVGFLKGEYTQYEGYQPPVTIDWQQRVSKVLECLPE